MNNNNHRTQASFIKKFKRMRLGALRSLYVLNVKKKASVLLLNEIEHVVVKLKFKEQVVKYFKSLDNYLLGRPMDT